MGGPQVRTKWGGGVGSFFPYFPGNINKTTGNLSLKLYIKYYLYGKAEV